jgi:hypothetical protein
MNPSTVNVESAPTGQRGVSPADARLTLVIQCFASRDSTSTCNARRTDGEAWAVALLRADAGRLTRLGAGKTPSDSA